MRQPGGGGWGMVPVVNSWFEGAGDGAKLRGTRRTQRELRIPIRAFAGDRQGVEDAIRLLAQSIHDPFQVFVDYHDGRSYYVDAVYEAGAEGLYGDDPTQYTDMPLILKTDPYWTSVQSQSFTVAPAAALAPFLPKWSALNVGSAVALGTVTVSNIGDVSSRPTWTIHGPGANLSIMMDGRGFSLNRVIPDTETITVEFAQGGWTIKNQLGVSLYTNLSTAPYFVEFPPGLSVVNVAMDSTGPASFIQSVYPERREILY
jgi:hypothetical protein